MTKEEITQKVIEAAAERVDLKPEEVLPVHRFREDLGFDSIDEIEFAMEMEEQFELSIPDEDAAKLLSVEQAIDYISAELAKAAAAAA
jgi:acyl carrier protein